MPDKEKVINGLRSIKTYLASQAIETTDSFAREGFIESQKDIDDALALLKDDETQIQYLNDHIEMCKEEVERLHKEQEAVTIKKTKEHGFGVYGGICPKCRNWIQSAHSFCGFCGQAVKWK
jgi:hypothetical protein